MIYGLGAALCWGFADFAGAVLARRTGVFRTLVLAQTASLLILVAVALLHGGFEAPGIAGLIVPANGAFATLAYFTLYRGLELGPVALVSPITAAYATVTILLAVVILGERIEGAALVGAVTTLVGVILASSDLRQLRRANEPRPARAATGIPHALVAMVAFGIATFSVGYYSRSLGWLEPVLLSRIGTVAVLVTWLTVRPDRRASLRLLASGRATTITISLAAAVGVVDVFGLISYSRGSELGLVSIVSAASAAFPLVPVAGGIVLFHERPRSRSSWEWPSSSGG
jgi:drug/metabolite transporter (DMT)-like permease